MTISFPTHSRIYQGDFPYFREPLQVGEFSLDEKRRFRHDDSQQKFVYWPLRKSLAIGESVNVNFDLNQGIQDVVRKDSALDERLENLLQWISINQHKFRTPVQDKDEKGYITSLSTDFVCYRGLLTKLMTTPYENQEGWLICASRWRGTIYLYSFDTDEKLAERQRETARQRAMSSWGFKFEQYMLSDTGGGRPRPELPCHETAEYCCVLRARLGAHSLVYGAEVDGVDPLQPTEKPHDMSRFVELKTTRIVETQRQQTALKRFKMLRWWAQSFLAGIRRLVVGFRDDNGLVRRIQSHGTAQLPHNQHHWSPAVCLNFADAFLAFVGCHVTGDDPSAVWRLEYRPHERRVTCQLLSGGGGAAVERCRVLPDWYIGHMFKPKAKEQVR